LPKRTIISNIKQTKTIPVSNLVKTSIHPSPQINGSFGSINNRPKPTINGAPITPPVWKNPLAGTNNPFVEVSKPAAIVDRLKTATRLR
jgi:hypothetical protein